MRTGSVSKTPKLSLHTKKNFFGGGAHKNYKPHNEILEGHEENDYNDESYNGENITHNSFMNMS